MTTDSQPAADRRNGRKSGGGPRSTAGKSRASRNALRHGLAAIIHRSPVPRGAIEPLARAICGDDADQQLFEAALVVGENHLLRRAIKAQQVAVIERLRDRAAIAFAKGDNSFALGKARFLAAWLMNREIEARIPALLAKYHFQSLPSRNATGDDIVPIELKALLDDCESEEEYQRAYNVVQKCVEQQERSDEEALEEAIPDLKRLDRYERRAWSAQKRAILEFMNIKLLQRLNASTVVQGSTAR